MNAISLRRVGSALCLFLACITVVLLGLGSDLGWITLAATGVTLVLGSYVQESYAWAVRAVMAAGGLALTLFGLLPWFDLAAANFS
ncbi:hypothetical protein G7085_14065 [Tessaracoccus sp. HDW20]|uniref:hypothetical protein n=1 Tax=Tessaracoccus coleopterorum TaxID=2714950 RepID=UPI0018D33003|nr:hypothetical protein [Tessaracoccus coleopterorum]NHB85366.1 hypothetical protein [Tessaracoccus coleopterorum]